MNVYYTYYMCILNISWSNCCLKMGKKRCIFLLMRLFSVKAHGKRFLGSSLVSCVFINFETIIAQKRSIMTKLINKWQERNNGRERELRQCTTCSAVLHKRICVLHHCAIEKTELKRATLSLRTLVSLANGNSLSKSQCCWKGHEKNTPALSIKGDDTHSNPMVIVSVQAMSFWEAFT